MLKRYITKTDFEDQLIANGDWPEYEVLPDTRWIIRGQKNKFNSVVESAVASNVYVKYVTQEELLGFN